MRPNQKRRTRKDLLQAAARLMKQGRRPGLEEVAEEALVSRATAYRYFPTIEALLAEASADVVTPEPETLFADLSDGKVQCTRRLYGENFMVDDSMWYGRAPGRPFGLEGLDRPLKFRLLHVIEFAETGAIRRENVWIDLAAIQRQLPPR